MESRPVWRPQKNRTYTLTLFDDTARASHTYDSLKMKGLDVSQTGISVKTSKRFGHEDYMEATRRCVLLTLSLRTATSYSTNSLRGLVKVAGASSFGKPENATTASSHDLSKMERVSSDSSSITSQEKKKKGFRLRK
jgi:hypothetical protein